MEVTGHTTRSTFDRYNIVDEEDAQEVIRRLEAGAASELAVAARQRSLERSRGAPLAGRARKKAKKDDNSRA